MISLLTLAAAAAVATPAPGADAARYNACLALARQTPEKAIAEASAWRDHGGGLLARQCLGLAFVAVERWVPAALAFEQAARDAEINGDARAATLWVQSANASLAADDAGKARLAFDRALGLPGLSAAMRGEALLDRGRALVELGNNGAARSDIDAALKLVPEDPMAWLLSATLARREGQATRAAADLAEAEARAPKDPEIAAERARITGMQAPSSAANGNRP